MRFRAFAATLVAILACASATGAQASQSASDPRAALDHFIAAFNALDWKAFRACLGDSASLFNPDIPGAVSLHRLDGRPEIERSFRVVFGPNPDGSANAGPNITPTNVRVQQGWLRLLGQISLRDKWICLGG